MIVGVISVGVMTVGGLSVGVMTWSLSIHAGIPTLCQRLAWIETNLIVFIAYMSYSDT